MSTYDTPFDASSFFVSENCLKDDIAEYSDKAEYVDCYKQRAKVNAVIGLVIVVIIAIILFWASTDPKNEIPAYYGGIAFGLGVVVIGGYYFIAGNMGSRKWAQHHGEMDILVKKYKIQNPDMSDEDAMILARNEQRDLKQQERMYRAQERQADAQSRMSYGFMMR